MIWVFLTIRGDAVRPREHDVERPAEMQWRIRVANRISGHVNHYDHCFPLGAVPDVLTVEWLDATEAKCREGLNDRFVDDACAVLLDMVGHCRRLLAEATL